MATRTDCPKDSHARILVVGTRRLTCDDKGCRCAECHRSVTELEMKDWKGE
jgi:hypothetical protein